MKLWNALSCILLAGLCSAQLPLRPLSIPGALLIPGAKSAPLRRISPDFNAPKPRRLTSNTVTAPLREVRPIIEDEEDEESSSPTSNFDAEVNKLGITALNSAIRQAAEEDEEQTARPSLVPFRPERPVPVTRDQIRERPVETLLRSTAPVPRPLPVVRQELRPIPASVPRPVRPIVRQDIDEEEDPLLRQPVRKTRPQTPSQQQIRATAPVQRAILRPQPQFEDDGSRRKKPPVQILRKYRTDNDDGSITWGFENEDGTFKEETLGTDCVTRGKYGYIDPDGVRREYTYETGNKCDPQDEVDEDLQQQPLPNAQPRKSLNIGKQPQFRPALTQFKN